MEEKIAFDVEDEGCCRCHDNVRRHDGFLLRGARLLFRPSILTAEKPDFLCPRCATEWLPWIDSWPLPVADNEFEVWDAADNIE